MRQIVLLIIYLFAGTFILNAQSIDSTKLYAYMKLLAKVDPGRNYDTLFRYFHEYDPRLYALQTIMPNNDTLQSPFMYYMANVYFEDVASSDDLEIGYDYAIGATKEDSGSFRLVCVDYDLSVRFSYPKGVLHAEPFNCGVSIMRNMDDWTWGAVNDNGDILFDCNHEYVYAYDGRVISVDVIQNANQVTVYELVSKDRFGSIQTKQCFCLPEYYSVLLHYDMKPYLHYDLKCYKALYTYHTRWATIPHTQQDEYLYIAFVNCVKQDYVSACYNLRKCIDGPDPKLKRIAKKNLKAVQKLLKWKLFTCYPRLE